MKARDMTLNRRGLIAGAAASLALPSAGLAATPLQGNLRPWFWRFRIGAFEVTSILDGVVQGDSMHPTFGQNVTADDVAALAEENFLPPARFEAFFTVTLVNTGAELILFDTGNGEGRRPGRGRLIERLAELGIAPGDITHVVITHFHPDHIGGMLENGEAAFPNAAYAMGAAEFDYWTTGDIPANRAGLVALIESNVLPFAEQSRMVGPGDAVISGIEAIDGSGHTPGHMIYHLESEGERLAITSDTANHYVMSLQRPDWHVRFDMDKEAAAARRKEIFGMLAADRVPFIGYHMPPPALGYVEAMGDGFRYIPASYQLNL
ncbi:MAG: MBL fold metallo-hydrolase [Pseudomonadota bacterium]